MVRVEWYRVISCQARESLEPLGVDEQGSVDEWPPTGHGHGTQGTVI